ncbi:hypothetical protein SBRCBS47491_004205 [Sporothrix bragantina]|uniref:Uncharacterized protein n=1 Tax=Sporothrix bragantina TaxID=671064 RepID=A0ABP0BLL4_9PEZI
MYQIVVQTVSPSSGTLSHSHSSPEASKPGSKDVKARLYSSSPLSQTSFSTDSAAPAPVILGFRGDETPSRADARSKGTLPSSSTASPRPSSRLSHLVAPRSRASLILAPDPVTADTARAKQKTHRPQSSISSSKLARSIRSDGGKGYVDLLDAQSELKPSDFHGRVKAAGTRDYGEDVADRNIGVNGCNLDSQPVQAFYAVRPRPTSRATTLDQRRPFSSWNRQPAFSDDDDDDIMYHPHVVKQQKGGTNLARLEQNEDVPRFAVSNQPILSPQPTSFRLSASLASSAFTASNKRPSTMHSMYSTQRSQQPSLESHSTMPDLSNLPYHLKETAHNFKEDWHDDLTDRESAPSPFIKTSRARSRSRDNARDYSRANSVVTPRPVSQSGETEDHTPGHANSARHWSMSSTAPTTSSASSATHGRPHSRHTANTSIDLSTTGPPSTLGSSLVSIHSDVAKKMQSPKPDSMQPPALLQSPPFNIDDYVSSDDDSFIASQAERSASEEDLLFGSGYGKNGMQLPGLEDAFSAPAPIARVRSPRDNFHRTLGESPLMTKFALPQMASDDSLNPDNARSQRKRSTGNTEPLLQKKSSREDFGNQAQSPARRSDTKRMSALLGSTASMGHSHHGNGALGINSLLFHPRPNPHLSHSNNVGEQVIEEERFEKVDVATAIRLRKEAKSRKRASVMSIASQTRGKSLVKTVNIEGRNTGSALQDKTGAIAGARSAHVPSLVRIASEDHEHAVVSDDE